MVPSPAPSDDSEASTLILSPEDLQSFNGAPHSPTSVTSDEAVSDEPGSDEAGSDEPEEPIEEAPFFSLHYQNPPIGAWLYRIWRSRDAFLSDLALILPFFVTHLTDLLSEQDLELFMVTLSAECVFQKVMEPSTEQIFWKHTCRRLVFPISYLRRDYLRDIAEDELIILRDLIRDIVTMGSGFVLKSINFVDVAIQKSVRLTHVNGRKKRTAHSPRKRKLEDLKIGCYFDLPAIFQSRHARNRWILNPQNKDQECFLRAVLYGLKKRYCSEEEYFQFRDTLNLSGIDFPITLKQISTFERKNEISVNVFFFEKDEIYPVQVGKVERKEKHVNLILFYNETTQMGHFVSISNFDNLIRKLKQAKTKGNHRVRQDFYCYFCMSSFKSAGQRNEHIDKSCVFLKSVAVKFPRMDRCFVKFDKSDYAKTLKTPFVIYMDSEAFPLPVDKKHSQSTFQKFKYEMNSYFLALVNQSGQLIESWFYRGLDPMRALMKDLKIIYDTVLGFLLSDSGCPTLTREEQYEYDATNICIFCKETFETFHINGDKCRHHDHATGKYVSAAHRYCNLLASLPYNAITVLAHNMSGFDGPLILSLLKQDMFDPDEDMNLRALGKSRTNYITFSFSNFKFIDTLNFLPGSLDSLVANLRTLGSPKKHFAALYDYFSEFSDEAVKMLLCKGAYPYEAVDSWDYFTRSKVPPLRHFASNFLKFESKTFTEEDYSRVKEIWKAFNCKNFGEYHDIYLKTDVLLLSSVFQNYRDLNYDNFQIDPTHYLTAPSLSWACMLKSTEIKLELIRDVDMSNLFELNLRGGITGLTQRKAKANHEFCENYQSDLDYSYLTQFDVNNLYGYQMLSILPYGGFEWVKNVENITEKWIEAVNPDGDTGYVLEVDLNYPENIKNETSDLPLAPTHENIVKEQLSPYMKDVMSRLQIPENSLKGRRLCLTQENKTHYVVHIRNLQLYLELGLQLGKVHKALKFKQKPWLKDFILQQVENRKKAQNKVLSQYYKLVINAVFGFSLHRKRLQTKTELTFDPYYASMRAEHPLCKSCNVMTENDLFVLDFAYKEVILDKPLYLGYCILELSKFHFYKLHYKVMKPLFKESLSLLYYDTDSMMYKINDSNVIAKLKTIREEYLDTSNLALSHPLYSPSNRMKPGLLKMEEAQEIIEEAVFLRCKCYAILFSSQKCKLAKKGINEPLAYCDYCNALVTRSAEDVKTPAVRSIRKYGFQLFCVEIEKNGFVAFDTKRYWFSLHSSVPYGHPSIPSQSTPSSNKRKHH